MPMREAVKSERADVSAEWREEGGVYFEPRLRALGVAHGVTSRSLGCMKDARARERAAAAAGIEGGILTLKQAHGTRVLGARREFEFGEGDGWVSGEKGRGVGVFSADCPAVFLWTKSLDRVALVHAGWRGIAAGMPEAAVAALAGLGASCAELSAAVGPHIGLCCYEVGRELEGRFAPQSFRREKNRLFLNLGGEARRRLAAAGVPEENIGVSKLCTMCRPEEFFSYRAQKQTFNMLAFIAVPG